MEEEIIVLNRFNRQKHKYEDYGVPANWNVKCYCNDLEEIVNCAQCGKELKYGYCFTSLEVHTDMGLGFAHSNISNCCKGKQKTAYGYIWKYKEGE
jgi:hypothetical protein